MPPTSPVLATGLATGLALASLAGTARAQATASPPPGARPPNVLVLVADDLGVDVLASYGLGTQLPNTPVLDALAAAGVRFENAWATPLCSPTRATLVTGRFGFRTGVGAHVPIQSGGHALPTAETTLPELLDLDGRYVHAAFGKWHLGNDDVGGLRAPNVAGFGYFAGTQGALSDYSSWDRIENGVTSHVTTYATSRIVDDVLAWVALAPEPWFAYVAFHAPHKPFHAPPANLHTVDLSQVNPDPDKEPRPYYEAMVEAMDTEIGRLLAGLGDPGLQRTTVLFLGDNGTPKEVTLAPFDPNHAKQTLYEGGVRVPLIAAGAGVTAGGQTCDALVQTVDLFATVASLAGAAGHLAHLRQDGLDLSPYFTDPQRPSDRTVLFSELFFPNGRDATVPPRCGRGFRLAAPRRRCARDIGFGGPGQASLEVCDRTGGSSYLGDLRLTGAPPNSAGVLFTSSGRTALPFQGGHVLFPLLSARPFSTDAAGNWTATVGGTSIFPFVTHQALILAPLLPRGLAISNAVRIEAVGGDAKALRGPRYKYMVETATCAESFFDLATDPFEANDLLRGVLTAAQRRELDRLRAALRALLAS